MSWDCLSVKLGNLVTDDVTCASHCRRLWKAFRDARAADRSDRTFRLIFRKHRIVSLSTLTRCALLALPTLLVGAAATAQQVSLGEEEPTGGIYVRLDDPALTSLVSERLQEQEVAPDPQTDVDAYMESAPFDAPSYDACCGDGYWGWTILPEGIIYRSYLAGVKESRLGLQVAHIADNDDEAGAMFEGTLGGRKGLIRYGNRNPYHPQGFQIDVEAAAQVRLNFEEDMDVQATDYRVGVPFTYGWENKQIKFGYWHVSSHLGDEFILRNTPNFTRFNYAKDSLVFGYSEYVTDRFRVYGEASWAFWSDVAEPWEFQFGFEHAPRCPTGIYGAPFFAANVNLREEVDFGGNFVVQTGWAWRADEGAGLLRLGLHYYNGKSSQRSFFNQFEEQIGFGVWYDF